MGEGDEKRVYESREEEGDLIHRDVLRGRRRKDSSGQDKGKVVHSLSRTY